MNNLIEIVSRTESQKLLEQTQQELVGIVEDALQKNMALHEVEQNLFQKVFSKAHHVLGNDKEHFLGE